MAPERSVKQMNRVVQTIANPIRAFLRLQSASGILLFAFTIVAIVRSNSRWSDRYEEWQHTTLSFGFGTFMFSNSLLHWINHGLMAVFFYVVGLEIKREILIGELSSLRNTSRKLVLMRRPWSLVLVGC